MNQRALQPAAPVLVALVLVNFPAVANACTACMGDPSSKSAGAINAAIFLMLGFIALMLASFGAFAWYLSRRATTGSAIPDSGFPNSSGSTDALS
jgi:hypothetical protein